MDKIIYGGDSETVAGQPNTLQFYSEDVACSDIFFVDKDTAREAFLKWCQSRKPDVQHVVYVHHLAFDLPEFIYGKQVLLTSGSGDFDFKIGRWHCKGVFGGPTFMSMSDQHHRRILFVDSMSWFAGSLASGAALVCPDLPKLRTPDGLGEKRFTKRDSGFVDYAMRDPQICYHMGKAIEVMHQEYDIQQAVSCADMAARIFRKAFLTYDIPQPSDDVIEASLLSYHGGKNNVTVKVGWYPEVSSLDISSAYPEGMHVLPAFSNAKLYKRYKRGGRGTNNVPDCGVYQVCGQTSDCPWPVLFTHSFKAIRGQVKDTWVQGYELNEALRSGEFKPTKITGHYYDAERDHQAPALRAFVDHFYAKKEAATSKVMRTLYKIGALNSLYGKFIQTRKAGTHAYTDIDSGCTVAASDLIAGGLFHPFIATAITAYTRAKIHRLEHKHKALHTATDGIFTQDKKARASGRGVGSITLEASDCTLLLVRNKCYVLYGKKSPKTKPSLVFKGKHIVKAALHGFQGSVSVLEKLVATGRRTYSTNRPNRLKESIKRGLQVNEFVRREHTLKIGPIPLQGKARPGKR